MSDPGKTQAGLRAAFNDSGYAVGGTESCLPQDGRAEWDTRLECFAPATVRKVYPSLLAFTQDWQITAQLPFGP